MIFALLLGPEGFAPTAGLPLTDRGFRYGMSVFETLALRAGAPLLLEPHLASLARAAAAAGFRLPPDWQPATRAALLAPGIDEGVARLYATAGDHDGDTSRLALLLEAMPIPTELTAARAVTVEFTPATPFGKTGNYWPHLLARPASGEEAILVAPDGRLLGGAMANLFLVRDGALLTPAQPIRRGIVREWIGADEAPLTRADLATADAAFLTNSRLGLCELTSIDGQELRNSSTEGNKGNEGRSPSSFPSFASVQNITAALWQRYREEVLRVR